jgi:7-cyano-7-deazaguanine synthase in queuosine biosynthesis
MPEAQDTFQSIRIVDPSRRSLVLLSGGLDSSVMAAWLQAHGHAIDAVYLDFGQGNYEREFPAAQRVWRYLGGGELTVIDLYQWRQSFKDEQKRDRVAFGSLPRNAFLAFAAVPHARLHRCDWIAFGPTLDDESAPDCNPEFIDRMNRLLVTLRQRERLVAPWLAKDNPWRKADVVRWALQRQGLGRSFIDMTWSCWNAKDQPCGDCQPCRARDKALADSQSSPGLPPTVDVAEEAVPRRRRGGRRDPAPADTLVTDGQLFRWFQESQKHPLSDDIKAVVEQSLRSLVSKETNDTRPGMLLGRVQSGKTRAYIGLLAMAFDSDFELAIVLTKNSVPLAEQTVKRLKQSFRRAVERDQLQVYDVRTKPKELTEWHLKQRLILVSMKEQANLKRLVGGKEAVLDQYPALETKRCLVVDDEADFASVGYKKDGSVVSINPVHFRLDALRSKLSRSSFLQVTATPYALYLQPEGHIAAAAPKGLRSHREGLYQPTRPAFTHILPESPGYVGGEFYFEASRQDDPVASRLHCPITNDELDALEPRGKPASSVDEIVEGDAVGKLRLALLAFVVGGYLRRERQRSAGETEQRYCFIVHTVTDMEGHEWQAKVVRALLDRLRHGATRSWFRDLCRQAYDDLIGSAGVEYNATFDEVIARVGEELGAVSTAIVNSEVDLEGLLDDNGQLAIDTPYKIFIGGQSLDRGITVDNLIGFYYGRRPTVARQDTVLQHSRMYGYRSREDLAVTRFYTTRGIYESMVRIDEFDRALREALRQVGPDHGVVFLQTDPDYRIEECDLRLMTSLKTVDDIPTEGNNLIVVAAVDDVLHFRVFDGDGNVAVKADEKTLKGKHPAIEDLRKKLVGLWRPHELTGDEKKQVIAKLTSIVGRTRIEPSSPEKIMASKLISLRTGDRVYNIPLGFNTRDRRQVDRVHQEIDGLLRNAGIAGEGAARLRLSHAMRIIELIAQSFEYPDSDPWDDATFAAVLRYLAGQSKTSGQRDTVAVLVRRGRRRDRVRTGDRFQNAPDSSSDTDAADPILPTLMLFEMRGHSEPGSKEGWKSEPFWWPVIRAGKLEHPVVFATRSRQRRRAK